MTKTWAPRMGACMLLATTAIVAALPAAAQAQAAARVEFDIPAGDTAQALTAFSRQAGVQILFPYDVAAKHRTAGLKGVFGREDAVRRLIEGGDLEIASATAQVITLRQRGAGPLDAAAASADAAEMVEELIVTSRAGSDARTRLATSYAVTTMNEETLRLRSPMGVADALKSVPGFWVEASGGEASANIRARGIPQEGFSAIALQEDGAPVQHDGGLGYLNADQSFRLDETIDRIEVVRGGPSSIFASYAPGGTVNFITRKGDVKEGLVKVQASDYGLKRVDAYYGGPIGDWRMGVGGFWREDDGVRDPGFTPNKGYQVRASIGRDFERGSFDFNIKHLDDNVILFAGVPLKFNGAGEPSAAPGFDPLTGTLAGPETEKLTLRGPKGPFNWDLSRGTEVKLTQATAALKYEVADGWRLQETLRYRTSESKRIGLFPNTPVLGANRIAQVQADFLKARGAATLGDAIPGAVALQLRYATNPSEVFGSTGAGQNGNGLVLDGSLRYVSVPLDELISDTRLVHKFEVGDQTHDVAAGFYRAHVEEAFNRYSANTLLDVRENARRLDLVAVDASGRALYSFTENGISRYGAEFANGDGKSNTTALYLTDEWQVTPALRIDAGVRWEKVEFTGRSERTATINLGLSPTPADDTVLAGSGVYDRFTRKFDHTGWTVGADYRISQHMGVFARYTSAFRLPSLGDYITNAANTAPIVQTMDLMEAGYKLTTGKIDLYATVFHTAYDALTFGSLVFNPTTGAYVNQTSVTDTKTLGLELEGTLRPVRWFDLGFSATLQNPEFGDYKFEESCSVSASDPTCQVKPPAATASRTRDFTGNQLVRVPKTAFRLTPGFNLADGRLRIESTVERYGQRFSDAANTSKLPTYTLVGATVRFSVTDQLTAYVYGTNLTNEIGLTEGNPRAGQIISGEAGALYGVGRPEFGRAFKAALLYRF
ncbi:TonB-dependent receptor [Caulobacter sp.]|uniref:TonB-dependent receptor n=1 Tax=Caulobacter sp. TaxID=78 RepID=UPI002B46883D|nr:TonB-dependent receptor [Caulobacter sp.]HJV42266.1 TonB-dependent receptor [Caulobacter sp.]